MASTFNYGYTNPQRPVFSEKSLYIELVGENTIALKMEGFFDTGIKDKIKSLPDAKYDSLSK
jgi:hypothetical protein